MRCAEVLFEREGMPWDPAPSRDKRKALAGESSGRAGNADPRTGERLTDGEIRAFYPSAGSKAGGIGFGEVSPTLKQDHNPVVSLDFHQQDARVRVSKQPDLSSTITAHAGTGGNNVPMVMCRADTQANAATGENLAPTLMAHASHDAPYIYRKAQTRQIRSDMADGSMTVRRLTPTECERLQGFPDGWTDIPYKGKPHPSDTVRYKALGNSMAVPVMRRIGKRIIIFDDRGR